MTDHVHAPTALPTGKQPPAPLGRKLGEVYDSSDVLVLVKSLCQLRYSHSLSETIAYLL
jgi:hypothetical protein